MFKLFSVATFCIGFFTAAWLDHDGNIGASGLAFCIFGLVFAEVCRQALNFILWAGTGLWRSAAGKRGNDDLLAPQVRLPSEPQECPKAIVGRKNRVQGLISVP